MLEKFCILRRRFKGVDERSILAPCIITTFFLCLKSEIVYPLAPFLRFFQNITSVQDTPSGACRVSPRPMFVNVVIMNSVVVNSRGKVTQ